MPTDNAVAKPGASDIAAALYTFVKSGSANGNEAMRSHCLKAAYGYDKLLAERDLFKRETAQLAKDAIELVEALRACVNALPEPDHTGDIEQIGDRWFRRPFDRNFCACSLHKAHRMSRALLSRIGGGK